MSAERHPLPRRDGLPCWQFQHGPIDLLIAAEGAASAVAAAFESAWRRFETVLPELVAELPALRRPIPALLSMAAPCPVQGAIARRMWRACAPYRTKFITPMAAVAGAVAQELMASFDRDGIHRAWVNNGGDIALHLASGASVKVGLFADLARFDPAASSLRTDADFAVHAAMPVRGIATSGWRGRSFSLGIADSVTVLALTAAQADAAATVIANAVNVADARIERRAANAVQDDSDLGDIEVTVDVPVLEVVLVDGALRAGRLRALDLQRAGLIHSAMLVCQGRFVGVGASALIDDPHPNPLPHAGEGEDRNPLPHAGEGGIRASLAPPAGEEAGRLPLLRAGEGGIRASLVPPAGEEAGRLPLPLAGEGWGEGAAVARAPSFA
jgi:uncharacterized protein